MLKHVKLSLFALFISLTASAQLLAPSPSAMVTPSNPIRIIVLTPTLAEWTAEILGEAEVMKQIVAVTDYSHYPSYMKRIQSVGPYPYLRIEQIASLKPTLIIGSTESNQAEQIEKIRRLKFKVEMMPVEKFGSMESWIKKLAKILKAEKGGEAAARKWTDGVALAKSRRRNKTPVKAVIQLQEKPNIVVGGASFLTDAFALMGYENAFSDLKQGYPKVSTEAILKKNPEVIFYLTHVAYGPHSDQFRDIVKSWSKFEQLKAVKNRRIVSIPDEDYARCSLRLLNELKRLH